MDYLFAYNEEKNYEFALVKSQGRFEDRINKKDFYYMRIIKKPIGKHISKAGQKGNQTYVTARIDKDIPLHFQKQIINDMKKDMFNLCYKDEAFDTEDKISFTVEDFIK